MFSAWMRKPYLKVDSWVVISGVISRVTIVVTHIGELITTHEPPSRPEP